MLYVTTITALIALLIFIKNSSLRVKYFYRGIYTDAGGVRIWRINNAIKRARNVEDVKRLKKLLALHIAGLVLLALTIVFSLIWMASIARVR